MARPRAADDFAVIRARMLELRREREQVVQGAADEPRPKPYHQPIDRLAAAPHRS
jgi:hypothetical protein